MSNEIPIYLRPELWLDLYTQGKVPEYSFFVRLMECAQDTEIGPILKFLPTNLFQEFKDTLSWWSQTEKEEDFVIVGSTPPSPLRLKDVWRVIRWLEKNPNPELAVAVENVPDD